MKNTKVYSVFPACGKSWLYDHQEEFGIKVLDSDSSYFSHIWECTDGDELGMYSPNAKKTSERNPSFPQNYVDHIKCKFESGKYDYIFVSSHEEVRKALTAAGIEFTVVVPDLRCKAEWVGRCFLRQLAGNQGFPVELMAKNFEDWVNSCIDGIHEEIVLYPGEYLKDVLNFH